MNKLPELQPKSVLVVAAHPDDVEFTCGGTLARWAKAGSEINYLICTDGSRGTSTNDLEPAELAKTRQAEQLAAAKVLGVRDVEFLSNQDGRLAPTTDLKRDIVRAICRYQPDVVITFDPTFFYSTQLQMVNHADHRAAGEAALDAVYPLARDSFHFPELAEEGLQPCKVPHLLLVNFFEHMDYYVDITGTLDQKLAALAEHKSQMPDMDKVGAMLRETAERCGRELECEAAEGFIRIDLS